MDKLPLLKLSKNEIHFWQQLGWKFKTNKQNHKPVQKPRVWKKRRVIKQRYRTETLVQPEPEEPLAPNFSQHQLTLDFVLQKSTTVERPNPPVNSVSAWKEEVYIYIWHHHWQMANTEHAVSRQREAQAWKGKLNWFK